VLLLYREGQHLAYSCIKQDAFGYLVAKTFSMTNLGAKAPLNRSKVKVQKVRYKYLGLTINLPLSLVLSDLF
jgi:hypothetical protein